LRKNTALNVMIIGLYVRLQGITLR